MKIISLKDFVLNYNPSKEQIFNYAKFLDNHLELGYFIVCDDDGNILEEPQMRPERNSFDEEDMDYDAQELYDYIKAKEKVLFKGIKFITNGGVNFLTINEDTFAFHDFNIKFKDLTVEFLVEYNLQLTESAIKQIGL